MAVRSLLFVLAFHIDRVIGIWKAGEVLCQTAGRGKNCVEVQCKTLMVQIWNTFAPGFDSVGFSVG